MMFSVNLIHKKSYRIIILLWIWTVSFLNKMFYFESKCLFFYFCACVHICVNLYHMCNMSEEAARSICIPKSCSYRMQWFTLCGYWDPDIGTLDDQQEFSKAEPSLQAQNVIFNYNNYYIVGISYLKIF